MAKPGIRFHSAKNNSVKFLKTKAKFSHPAIENLQDKAIFLPERGNGALSSSSAQAAGHRLGADAEATQFEHSGVIQPSYRTSPTNSAMEYCARPQVNYLLTIETGSLTLPSLPKPGAEYSNQMRVLSRA